MVLEDNTEIRCIYCNCLKDYKSSYKETGFPPFCHKCWKNVSNKHLKAFLQVFNGKLYYLENPSPWADDYGPVKEASLKNRPKKDLANEVKKEIDSDLELAKSMLESAKTEDEKERCQLEVRYLEEHQMGADTFHRNYNK